MLGNASLFSPERIDSLGEEQINFTDIEQLIFRSVSLVSATISTVGVIFIVISYIIFPRLRSFSFEIVLMLAMADVVGSSSYFFLVDNYGGYDQVEVHAILITFSKLSSLFWVGSIAFLIHMIYLWENSSSISHKQRWKYHMFSWGSSILFTALPFSTEVNKCRGSMWCWIALDTILSWIWALTCYFIPLLIILVYLLFVYYKTWRILRLRESFSKSQKEKLFPQSGLSPRHQVIIDTRIWIYPAIFFITIICSTLDRIWQLALEKRHFSLFLLSMVAINIQGFLNAMVYGSTKAVRSEWQALLCCRNKKVINDNFFKEEKVDDSPASIGDKTGDTMSTYMVASSMYSEESKVNSCSGSSAFMIMS